MRETKQREGEYGALHEALARLRAAMASAEAERKMPLATFFSTMEPAFRSAGYRVEGPRRRILVLRWDEIGDSVLTSAFLRELRQNFPQARIDLVVKPVAFGIMEHCPYVNHVWAVAPEMVMSEAWGAWAGAFCRDLLWPVHYDVCFLPRWDVDLAFAPLIAYLSGARERIGFSEHVNPLKEARDRGFDGFLTQAVVTPPYLVHEVQKMSFLLRAAGLRVRSERLECWVTDKDVARARSFVAQTGVSEGGFYLSRLGRGSSYAPVCQPAGR